MAARPSRAKHSRAKRAVAPKPKAKRAKRGARTPAARAKKAAAKVYGNLAALRRDIDRVDGALVPLLCRRLALVCQAAKFKPSHSGVVVHSRVEEIIMRVRALAAELGSNADTLETVYRTIIDQFTVEEQRYWQALNARDD